MEFVHRRGLVQIPEEAESFTFPPYPPPDGQLITGWGQLAADLMNMALKRK
jgi:hypothetical protein